MVTRAASWKSIDEAIHELQTMSRRDLVSLYLDCEHPQIDDLAVTIEQTDENWVYDGYLLSNGRILVRGYLVKSCMIFKNKHLRAQKVT